MTYFRLSALLLPLCVCALTGCKTLMQSAPLPEGFAVRKVAKADAGAPFALSRNGAIAAVSKGTITFIDGKGNDRKIAEGKATALSFSPDGERLAAALPANEKTILRLFDREGKTVSEASIPEKVTSIAWRSDRELLAAALHINKYRFGSLLTSQLYRWDGATSPVATKLTDNTVRPAVGNLPQELLYRSLGMAVSPYGDEIAYSALKDPPLFTPYLTIAVRHLETGAEREIAKSAIGSGAPLYAPDGESLVVGDLQGVTRRLSVPQAKELEAWPSPGSYPALSPSGAYIYLDGRLYQNGRTITSFPTEAKGAFLPDGSGLALSYDGMLYIVTGLKDGAAPTLPANMDKLLQLRRLRSSGLTSDAEFRTQQGALDK